MAEAYCKKSCETCPQKEVLACPGCKAGPGRPVYGDCKLAQCCRDKGHEFCATCSFCGNCGTMLNRYEVPKERIEKIEAEIAWRKKSAEKAAFLGKWIRVLFWLFIPEILASVMTTESLGGQIPAIAVAGAVLSFGVTVAYHLILRKISSENDRYRTASTCGLAGLVIGQVGELFSEVGTAGGAALLFSIPASIIALVGIYNEFLAHSEVLHGINGKLSEKWCGLWKWYMISLGGVFGSILVILISPMLGMVVIFASAIGMLVVQICKIVYLYRTANVFRNYRAGEM